MDVDSELLDRMAAAAVHVGRQATIHNEAEVRGSVPGLLETLAPDEPYAYMLMPEFQPDGSIRLPVQNTRQEVNDIYEIVRGRSDVLSEEPIIELRGPWYAFWESVSSGRVKATGDCHEHPLAVLSPVGSDDGIAGEIIWPKLPPSMLGVGPEPFGDDADEWQVRRELRHQHNRFLRSLESTDAEGIVAELNDGAASAVRDYAHDTGRLVQLAGKDEHREYWEAFFDRYEVASVELLQRVAQVWYLFAEIRVTVRERGNGVTGDTLGFHTAEIHAPAKDGRLIACLGWGTDPT
jgi:hypothetical protein